MRDDEQWRAIPGYEGSYEVSNRGRVRSLDRISHQGRPVKGRVLTNVSTPKGYQQVTLHRDGQQFTPNVHRLVILAFRGSPPNGMEVRHLNGNPGDNTIANLAYGTHLENMADKRLHGTNWNSGKSHCPSGHPYTGDNLMVDRHGNRRCVICRRESFRRANARRSPRRNAEAA